MLRKIPLIFVFLPESLYKLIKSYLNTLKESKNINNQYQKKNSIRQTPKV